MDPLEYRCPRCGVDTTSAHYGPCDRCRAQLRDTMRSEPRQVSHEYEPKMNVTPDAVALKDD